jgi:uncharacterized protein
MKRRFASVKLKAVPNLYLRPVAACCVAVAFMFMAPPSASAMELDALSKAAANYHGGSLASAEAYTQCLLSTIRNDVSVAPDKTTYVITGDIGAMWLRDASAQMRPYLSFATDAQVKSMLRGVIAREAKSILVDPYANAFNRDYKVTEEKFELDSLAYPIVLTWSYWKQTNDRSALTPEVKAAFEKAAGLMELERDHSLSHYRHGELPNNGAGSPVGYTGMIWTGFRPSDDAAQYGYNIPEEMFAAVALSELADLESNAWHDKAMATEVSALRDGVVQGINEYAVVYRAPYGYMYAYEVDGLGHSNVMDDANIPSLLSIPYIGYAADPAIYRNTRRFILSSDNPYYFAGKSARGIGSPHTPKGYVWPLALVMQGLTSENPKELSDVLAQLKASDTGDHLMHESFDANDPSKYTRSNFGWACSLFAELVQNRVMGISSPLPPGKVGLTTNSTTAAIFHRVGK